MNKEVEKIRIYGDPVLRRTTETVTVFDNDLRDLRDHLITTLYEAKNGVGLAAPQIGISMRIAVIDLSLGKDVDNILTVVNPRIIETEGESIEEEGCLSIPEISQKVIRAERVKIRFTDMKGREKDYEAEGFIARVIQHEIDHLDGILFIDRIGVVRRALISKKLRELAKESGGGE
jgi:peptide deformylase